MTKRLMCHFGHLVGGPDLNPVVFLGGIVTSIATEVANQNGLVYPGGEGNSCSRRLGSLVDDIRQLGSSSGSSVIVHDLARVACRYSNLTKSCAAYSTS